MIVRTILAAALFEFGAMAQLQLNYFDGANDTPIAGLFDAGSAAPGDKLDLRFHIRNLGTAPATVQTIVVAGSGFRLSAQPLLPYVLASQATVEFRIAFSPTSPGAYSAAVTVNTTTVTIRVSAIAAALLSFGQTQLGAGGVADFGQTEWGTTITKSFTLTNPTPEPMAIGSVAVSGDAFSGPAGISAPLQLPPGGSASFDVVFAPKVAGQASGTLSIDKRVFKLAGFGLAPPLPKGTIVVSSQTVASGQQLKVSIVLAASSKVKGSGTLAMEFRPSSGLDDDAAVQFLSGAKRAASVAVSAGDSAAKIGGQDGILFQTGTTAGTIVFTLTLPNSSDQLTIPIAPASVSVTTSSGVRRVNDLDVSIAGFDNTHAVGQLGFTFYDSSGRVIQPGMIRVDAAPDFKRYFTSNPTYGGMFTMRATFPVTGDATQIGGVDVQISNPVGVTTLQRITF